MDMEDLRDFLKFCGLILVSGVIWIGMLVVIGTILNALGINFFIVLRGI